MVCLGPSVWLAFGISGRCPPRVEEAGRGRGGASYMRAPAPPLPSPAACWPSFQCIGVLWCLHIIFERLASAVDSPQRVAGHCWFA
eukprot:360838-Chlamydomonas_euryale.AAC.3